MNLIEVTNLIESIPDDEPMKEFYTGKREVLVNEINRDLVKKGLPEMTLEELLTITRG